MGRGSEGLRDVRLGGRPSGSVSEKICHFNDVIFLAWLLSVVARGGQLFPQVTRCWTGRACPDA